MTETVEVVAEKMAAGGDALAHAPDGRVAFVEGALPGERVRVQVRSSKRDFLKGSVVEVLEASPDRVVPPCPGHVRGCGGCAWQHVAPTAQLALKTSIVADALRRTARLPEAVVRPGASVPPWAYRTTVRLAVGADGRVGLRAASSHRVVGLSGCDVAHPTLAGLLPGIRVQGAAEVVLRVGDDGLTVLPLDPRGRPTSARVEGLPAGTVVGADGAVHIRVGDARLRVSAGSFFQSGPAAASLLVASVAEACGDALRTAGTFLDAYGGVGLFASALGRADAVLVESSPSACADARHNLPLAEVVEVPFEHWRPRSVDLAVVDPARAGLGAASAAVLDATGAARVVLVSCDPVAMARDVAVLTTNGYVHRSSVVLDLFPQTPHVEVVTVLDR
jgi:23S rRNA (uracil1939-C5)-methyltransferase